MKSKTKTLVAAICGCLSVFGAESVENYMEPLSPILPVAVEQYHWYVPVNAALAKMIRTYLALYAAERNPLDLAKAKALGDALTRAQCESGCIPSEWMGPINPKSSQTTWINCQLATAGALVDLTKYEKKERQ